MDSRTIELKELQLDLHTRPPQLLKWIGSKHRSALTIARFVPESFGTYFEPFLGGGAVLGTVSPARGVAGDILAPLIAIWRAAQSSPKELVDAYADRWHQYVRDPQATYNHVRARYNRNPNRDDLLFLCRSCYGGVVRFTREGTMSTPIGAHTPISPQALRMRSDEWRSRLRGTKFVIHGFEATMADARVGDVVYCDPPYSHTQAILYGAQTFTLERLFAAIESAVRRGAKVLLSLDGTKKSGKVNLHSDLPAGLFQRQVLLGQGGSMLRRFQKRGKSVHDERVEDRLLLTW